MEDKDSKRKEAHKKTNYEEGIRKGIQSALDKAPVREGEKIYLTDLWTITSLPEEIIIKELRKGKIRLPEKVGEVVDDREENKKTLLSRKRM
ncbi:MAG: hypothetical protein U9O65_04720 [Thermotogota bacterium]|nr:hypothetical protein [Thermotogota bacterium]